jgi:hypothetical protein
LICPNCGRRNSTGATFCSRCHQRLPLVNKIGGNQRRTVVVDPRGGGSSMAVVLAIALLAGMLFIGGAAAIYLSNPPGSSDPTQIAFASGSPTLPPFVQPTATPSPTPTPTFILLPSDSPSFGTFSPLPTITPTGQTPAPTPQPTTPPQPTPKPTNGPPTATPVAGVEAKFTCTREGVSKTIDCVDHSTGPVTSWLWNFGDNTTSNQQNPGPHTYAEYRDKPYKVTLVVTGPGGATSFRQKDIDVSAPPCNNSGQPEGCKPTPSPAPTDAPTPEPTPTSEPTPSPTPS